MSDSSIASTTSDGIRVARVLCIVFMSYAHLHFFKLPGAEFPVIESVVVDTLGRSSIPLLSILSGLLMVGFFSRRGWLAASASRFRSLIVPMMLWNFIAVAIWGYDSLPNDVLALTSPSKLIYLAFLRDLFVLSLLTPGLIYLARKMPIGLFAAVSILNLGDVTSPLVLRPQIAFFYCLGVLIATNPIRVPKALAVSLAFAFVGLVMAEIWIPEINSRLFDNLVRRPITAGTFWIASLWLAERSRRIVQLDNAAFPFFLMHGIIFHAVGALYYRMPELHTVPIYLTVWLITPPICFAIVYVMWPKTGRVGKLLTT